MCIEFVRLIPSTAFANRLEPTYIRGFFLLLFSLTMEGAPHPTKLSDRLISPSLSSMTLMSSPLAMPILGSRKAPIFDGKPESLRRYFANVEHLFRRSEPLSDVEQKDYVVYYLGDGEWDTWRSLPEFSDHSSSFMDFKAAVLALYPTSRLEYKFSLQHLEQVVSEQAQTPMHNVEDYAAYYRAFFPVSAHLTERGQLCAPQEADMFVSALPCKLQIAIQKRLIIKYVDQHPEDPWTLSQIHEAALYALEREYYVLTSLQIASPILPAPAPLPQVASSVSAPPPHSAGLVP